MVVTIYGYTEGCPACDALKALLINHGIEYRFIPVERGQHPFKTVPQTIYNDEMVGDYSFWKRHLEG